MAGTFEAGDLDIAQPLECLRRAAECHLKADKAKSVEARAFFLDAESKWLSIATTYETNTGETGEQKPQQHAPRAAEFVAS